MKLELEVLTSTSIKRKKPWPCIAWMGEEQESLFLMDCQRLSVLYVPSGKTKRKIPKLSHLLKDVVSFTYSDNGHFLLGLLSSGDLFLWHKDRDMFKLIHGLRELSVFLQPVERQSDQQLLVQPCLFLAADGSKVLVIINYNEIYLWEMNATCNLFSPKQADVQGVWSHIDIDDNIPRPNPTYKETSVSAVFYISEVLGLCCQCSFIFNVGNAVNVSTLFLQWHETDQVFSNSFPVYTAEWSHLQFSLKEISTLSQPLRSHGAISSCYSSDGQLLACAVNQKVPQHNRILFVSAMSDTVTVADMKGCSSRGAVHGNGRSYWVCSMQWTFDSLFLVSMTKQGSLCILTRLGEPLYIQTYGFSLELGPSLFLPLHPLITVGTTANRPGTPDSEMSERDLMRQRFSVACHPRLPMILCSDGYMVTVMQLPGELTCLSLMKGLLMESNSFLNRLEEDQGVLPALGETNILRSKHRKGGKKSGSSKSFRRMGLLGSMLLELDERYSGILTSRGRKLLYTFEEPNMTGGGFGNTASSDFSEFGGHGVSTPFVVGDDVKDGKIFFGSFDNLNTSVDMGTLNENCENITQILSKLQERLLLGWAMAASHAGIWSYQHEKVIMHLLQNFLKLFAAILRCDPAAMAYPDDVSDESGSSMKTKNLNQVIDLYRRVIGLLCMDNVHQNMMPCLLKFTHLTVKLLLSSTELKASEARIHMLYGCYTIIRCAEKKMNVTYFLSPVKSHNNASLSVPQIHCTDVRAPSVFPSGGVAGNKLIILGDNPPMCHKRASVHMEMSVDFPVTPDHNMISGDVRLVEGSPKSHARDRGIREEAGSLRSESVQSDVGMADTGHETVSADGRREVDDVSTIGKPTVREVVEDDEVVSYVMVHGLYLHGQIQRRPTDDTALPAKRLCRTWKYLYRHVMELHRKLVRLKPKKHALYKQRSLIKLLQLKMQMIQCKLHSKAKGKQKIEEMLPLECNISYALELWKEKLHKMTTEHLNGTAGSRVLHALLYTLLQQGALTTCVHLAELLLGQQDVGKAVSISQQSAELVHTHIAMLAQALKNNGELPRLERQSSRDLLQSLARILAAYFCNKPVYILPPHAAQKIPPLHLSSHKGLRKVPLYHESLSSVIRQEGLSGVLTPDKTLEYLLLSGLFAESVWFSKTVGDWKVALILSVAATQHAELLPHIYNRKREELMLPDDLQPQAIVMWKLKSVFEDSTDRQGGERSSGRRLSRSISAGSNMSENDAEFQQFQKTISDLLTVGTVCGVDIVPWLLSSLMNRLKGVVKQMSPLVTEDVYLPAPPLYCPQPTNDNTELSDEVLRELTLRQEASLVIQLLLTVLSSAHISLPAARWYIRKLKEAYRKASKLKKRGAPLDETLIENLQMYASTRSSLREHERDGSVRQVLSYFRDFCSVVWMLHARDKLSLGLRKKVKLLDGKVSEENWYNHSCSCLMWSVHLLPFTRFLGDDCEVADILLSLLMELPRSKHTASVLAEHFRDKDSLDPLIQDKLDSVLRDWQAVFIDDEGKETTAAPNEAQRPDLPGKSPRGVTIPLFYHKQCGKVEKLNQQKVRVFGSYEHFVFEKDGSQDGTEECDTSMNVGSRPFEGESDYLYFLDTLFAVSFSKELDLEEDIQSQNILPCLLPFSADVRKKELSLLSHKVAMGLKEKSAHSPKKVHPNFSPVRTSSRTESDKLSSSSKRKKPKIKAKGLFRSRSFSDVSPSKLLPWMGAYSSVQKKPGYANDVLIQSSKQPVKRSVSFQDSPHVLAQGRSQSFEDMLEGGRELDQILNTSLDSPSLHDSMGMSDVKSQHTEETVPFVTVFDPALIKVGAFGSKYEHIKNLLNWLSHWAGKHHVFHLQAEEREDLNLKHAIKLSVMPSVILYSLWLIETKYYPATVINDLSAPVRQAPTVPAVTSPTPQTVISPEPIQKIEREDSTEVDDNEEIEEYIEKEECIEKEVIEKKEAKIKKEDIQPVFRNIPVEQEADDPLEPRKLTRKNTRSKSHKYRTISKPKWDEYELNEKLDMADLPVKLSKSANSPADFWQIPRNLTVYTVHTAKHSPMRDENAHSTDRRTEYAPKDSSTSHEDDTLNVSSLGEDELQETMKTMQMELAKLSVHDRTLRMEDLTQSISKLSDHAPTKTPSSMEDTFMPEVLSANQAQFRPDSRLPYRVEGTQASAGFVPGSQEFASQLRDVVQKEMRKIMQIQHEGILTMLRALDQPQVPASSQDTLSHPGNETSLKGAALRFPDHAPRLHRDPHAVHFHPTPNSFNSKEPKKTSFSQTAQVIPAPLSYQTDQHRSGENKENQFSASADHKGEEEDPGAERVPRLLKLTAEKDEQAPFHLPNIPLKNNQSDFQNTSVFSNVQRLPFLSLENRPAPLRIVPPDLAMNAWPPPPPPPPLQMLKLPSYPQVYPEPTLLSYDPPKPQMPEQLQRHLLHAQNQHLQQAAEDVQKIKEEKAENEHVPPVSSSKSSKKRKSRRKLIEQDEEETSDLEKTVQSEIVSDVKMDKPEKKKSTQDVGVQGSPAADDVGEKLHSGYALTPGLFDEYLHHQDELGDAADNNAKLQYKAVTALQKQPEKVTYCDAAVETERETTNRATTFSVEAATSPRKEVVAGRTASESGLTEPVTTGNSILPPDIFLQLKYDRTDPNNTGSGAAVSEKTNGRSYINVVDIYDEKLITDLVSSVPERAAVHSTAGSDPTSRHSTAVHTQGMAPEKDEYALPTPVTASVRPPGPDRLTSKLFSAGVENDEMPEDLLLLSRRRTKQQIGRKLVEMNEQVKAIDSIAQNMEKDFQASRMIIGTLSHLGEARSPERQAPSAAVFQKVGDITTEASHLSTDRRAKIDSARKTRDSDELADTRDRELVYTADSNLSLPQDEDSKDLEEFKLALTQASREEEEMISKFAEHTGPFEHDTQQPEVTPRSQRKAPHTPRGTLSKRDMKRKEQEREYMSQRTKLASDLMNEIMADRLELPKQPVPAVNESIGSARASTYRSSVGRNASPGRHGSTKNLSSSIRRPSPSRTEIERTVSPMKRHRPVVSPRRGRAAPLSTLQYTDKQDYDQILVSYEDYMHIRDSQDFARQDQPDDPQPITKPVHVDSRERYMKQSKPVDAGLDHRPQTGITTKVEETGLNERSKNRQFITSVDDSQELTQLSNVEEVTGRVKTSLEMQEVSHQVAPYTDFVKMQRPEALRSSKIPKKSSTYAERLSSLSAKKFPVPQRSVSKSEQMKIYGSKRLPDTKKEAPRARKVKSYAERLKEMKQNRIASSPFSQTRTIPTKGFPGRKSSTGGGTFVMERRGTQPAKPRKQLTYAERLQQLQPPARYSSRPVSQYQEKSDTFRAPTKKPMTYVEQLQSLTARSPRMKLHGTAYGPVMYKRYQSQPLRSLVRSRPYIDPYNEGLYNVGEDKDDNSILSSWSLDNNVKKLLYDDQSIYSTHASAYDASEMSTDLENILAADYTSLVDIHDIEDKADICSVGSASVLSFIDWDAVDRLISDVT